MSPVSSVIQVIAISGSRQVAYTCNSLWVNNSPHFIALYNPDDVLRIIQTENPDTRNLILLADGNRRRIHYLQVLIKDIVVIDVLQQLCILVEARIAVIYTVNVLCKQDSICPNLYSAKCSSRVRRKEGMRRRARKSRKAVKEPFPNGLKARPQCPFPYANASSFDTVMISS